MTTFNRCLEMTGPLAEQVMTLWRQQVESWPLLAEGLAALEQARTREFRLGDSRVVAQCNPARIKSASARVDPASVAARPCFLCPGRLPDQQRAISYAKRWLILCNPAPLFDLHLTVVSVEHEPQRVKQAFPIMLQMARDLDGRYTLFYNGPLCGASLPDHLHFQATLVERMPFEQELGMAMCDDQSPGAAPGLDRLRSGPVHVAVTAAPCRPAVVLASRALDPLAAELDRVIETLGQIHPASPEPMLNLFLRYGQSGWLVWLFARAAHRPSLYGEGPDRLLISPGAADLGGLLIIPRPGDFDRLDAGLVQYIYDQVLLSPEKFALLRDRLADRRQAGDKI